MSLVWTEFNPTCRHVVRPDEPWKLTAKRTTTAGFKKTHDLSVFLDIKSKFVIDQFTEESFCWKSFSMDLCQIWRNLIG